MRDGICRAGWEQRPWYYGGSRNPRPGQNACGRRAMVGEIFKQEDQMRRASLIGLVLLWPMTFFAAEKVQPLNIKPGRWETTMTTTTKGEMPLPADALSKMTPEQRAQIEATMKANSGEKTRTYTYKSCVTKEDLEKGMAFGQDEDKKCTHTVLTSTDSRIEVRVACTQEGMSLGGTLHVEALSPVSVKGASQMSGSGGGNTMNVKSSFTSKWIGAVCNKTEDETE